MDDHHETCATVRELFGRNVPSRSSGLFEMAILPADQDAAASSAGNDALDERGRRANKRVERFHDASVCQRYSESRGFLWCLVPGLSTMRWEERRHARRV